VSRSLVKTVYASCLAAKTATDENGTISEPGKCYQDFLVSLLQKRFHCQFKLQFESNKIKNVAKIMYIRFWNTVHMEDMNQKQLDTEIVVKTDVFCWSEKLDNF